jgi:hypothetical protein
LHLPGRKQILALAAVYLSYRIYHGDTEEVASRLQTIPSIPSDLHPLIYEKVMTITKDGGKWSKEHEKEFFIEDARH